MFEKTQIDRKSLKGNILRKIILRFDYKGIVEIKQSIEFLLKKILSEDFDILNEKYLSELDFDLKDPELIETTVDIPKKELKKIKVYEFISKDKLVNLKISKYFLELRIKCDKYKNFEHYSELFSNVIKILNENNEFLRGLRIGVRKINSVYFTDISKIYDYLEKDYFSNSVLKLQEDSHNANVIRSETIDTFKLNNTQFNMIRYMDSGEMYLDNEPKIAYQVVLDIDGYVRNQDDIENIIKDKDIIKHLNAVNEQIFVLFKQTLTKKFLKMLVMGQSDNYIIGVDLNE